MFGRVSFFPSLIYNIMMEKCSRRRWYDRIDDLVVLGALPFKKTAQRLIAEENIGAVISMNENYELIICMNGKKWKELDIEFLQLSTVDIFSAPAQSKLQRGVEFLDQFRSRKKSVYVHCKAGRTRSTTLVACYLMKRYNMEPGIAVKHIVERRPHILLHTKQWQAIHQFYDTIHPRRKR